MSGEHRAQHSAAESQPSDGSPSGVLGDQRRRGGHAERTGRSEEGGREGELGYRCWAGVGRGGDEEGDREESRGGAGEERVQREEEGRGYPEVGVEAARGDREVDYGGGGRERGLESEDSEPSLADGIARSAARRGPVHGGGGRGVWEVLNLFFLSPFLCEGLRVSSRLKGEEEGNE